MPNASPHLSAGMAAKIRFGDLAGRAPIGYENTRCNGRTFVVPDPAKAPAVVQAFELARSHGWSLRRILTELAPRGLVTRAGQALTPSVLLGALTNPFYTGLIRYKGELHRGNHEPLVSWAVFQEVQVRLLQRRRRN